MYGWKKEFTYFGIVMSLPNPETLTEKIEKKETFEKKKKKNLNFSTGVTCSLMPDVRSYPLPPKLC